MPDDDEVRWCQWMLECQRQARKVVLAHQARGRGFADLLQLPYRYEKIDVAFRFPGVILASWLKAKGEKGATSCRNAADTLLSLLHAAYEHAIYDGQVSRIDREISYVVSGNHLASVATRKRHLDIFARHGLIAINRDAFVINDAVSREMASWAWSFLLQQLDREDEEIRAQLRRAQC